MKILLKNTVLGCALFVASCIPLSHVADAETEVTPQPDFDFGGSVVATFAYAPGLSFEGTQVLGSRNETVGTGHVWGSLLRSISGGEEGFFLRGGAAATAKYTSWDESAEIEEEKYRTDRLLVEEAYLGSEYRSGATAYFADAGWLEPAVASHGLIGKPNPIGTVSAYGGTHVFPFAEAEPVTFDVDDLTGVDEYTEDELVEEDLVPVTNLLRDASAEIGMDFRRALGENVRGAAIRLGARHERGFSYAASFHNSLRIDDFGKVPAVDKDRALSATVQYHYGGEVGEPSIRVGVDFVKPHEDLQAGGHWGIGAAFESTRPEGGWAWYIRYDRYGNELPKEWDVELTRSLVSTTLQYRRNKWRYQFGAFGGRSEGNLTGGIGATARVLRSVLSMVPESDQEDENFVGLYGKIDELEGKIDIGGILFGVAYAIYPQVELGATLGLEAARFVDKSKTIFEDEEAEIPLIHGSGALHLSFEF